MTCNDCQNAILKSEDKAISRLMERYGNAICAAYSKRAKQAGKVNWRVMVPLINAAGMLCNGRDYLANEIQGSLI